MRFVLVHGAYGRGVLFAPLAAALRERGHEVAAPDLPIEDRSATFADYAAVVAEAAGDAGDVHLVGHSMGAVSAALAASARPDSRVTYLAAVLPRPGEALAGVLGEAIEPGVVAAEERGEDGLRRLPLAACLELVLDDVPADVASSAAGAMRGQAVAPYFEPVALDALPPGRSIVCRGDRVVSPAYGRAATEALLGAGALVELDGGHSPALSRPRELASLLLEAA